MKALNRLARRFVRDDSGATAIEYGLICTFITLVIVSTLQVLGDTLVSEYYDKIVAAFN